MIWLPRIVLRTFGVLHLAFGALGFYLLFGAVAAYATNPDRVHDPEVPYKVEAFIVRTSINFVFLVLLFFAGLWLLKLRSQGVRLSNWLFVFKIIYFLAPPFLFRGTGPLAMSIAATGGTGEMGTTPMLITGYPILALIGLNISYKYLTKRKGGPMAGVTGLKEAG